MEDEKRKLWGELEKAFGIYERLDGERGAGNLPASGEQGCARPI